jgi:hypothetical protein
VLNVRMVFSRGYFSACDVFRDDSGSFNDGFHFVDYCAAW